MLALEEADVYDPQSPYSLKMVEYVNALRIQDEGEISKLEIWFEENYPYLTESQLGSLSRL